MKKCKTEEERKLRRKASQSKYHKSDKAKRKVAAYRATPKGKAILERYKASPARAACKAKYDAKNRRNVLKKIKYVIAFGSKCFDCGLKLNKNNLCVFQFHHRDPKTKDGTLRWSRPDKWLDSETAKCDMLCANCHSMTHYKGVSYEQHII